MTWWQCLLYDHLIINLEVLLIIKVFIKSSMPCSMDSSLLCPVLLSLDCVRGPHRLTDCAHWGLFKYTRVRLTWKQSSGRKWNEAFSEPISSAKTHHWIEMFGLHMTGGGTHCYLSFYLVDWWLDEAVYACHLSVVSWSAAPTFKWLATLLNEASRACSLVKVSFQHNMLPTFLLHSQPPEADLCSKGIFIRILSFMHQLVLWHLALELLFWFLKPSLVISKA